jgi:hypothetical protein
LSMHIASGVASQAVLGGMLPRRWGAVENIVHRGRGREQGPHRDGPV